MKVPNVNQNQPVLAGPFNDWIYETMERRGIKTVEDFSRVSGIPRSTMYHLVKGRVSPKGTWVKPSVDTLVLLATVLGRSVQDLIFRLEPTAPGHDQAAPPTEGVSVRVVGYVGAGPGQLEGIENGVVYVPRRVARGKSLAAYQVKGDSMCGGRRPICDGDTIVINRDDKGASGSPVVARLKDGTCVCKALKEDKFGRRLMSLNALYTNFTPPVIPADDVEEILGRVIWIQGVVGKLEE